MGTPNRYYSSTAVRTTLTADVSASGTALKVASTSGWPGSTPFTIMLDAGTASEELVTVTGISGTNLTVTRGVDGTSGVAHSTGADVRHAWSAQDLREPQEHIAATSNVHGVGSGASVVGTSTTQALTNKTMDGSLNTFTNLPKSSIPATTVYTTDTQTLSNKTLDGSQNTFTNIPKTALPATVVYTTDTQTLTGKTLDGASNTFTNIPAATALTGVVPAANLVSEDWTDRSKGSSWSSGTLKSKLSAGHTSIYATMSRDTSITTSTSVSTVMFTLPAAYRPPYDWPVIGTHVIGNETRFFRVVISASTGEATLTVDQGSGNLSAAASVNFTATWPTTA